MENTASYTGLLDAKAKIIESMKKIRPLWLLPPLLWGAFPIPMHPVRSRLEELRLWTAHNTRVAALSLLLSSHLMIALTCTLPASSLSRSNISNFWSLRIHTVPDFSDSIAAFWVNLFIFSLILSTLLLWFVAYSSHLRHSPSLDYTPSSIRQPSPAL